jgi:hypothetical protein
MDAVLGIVRDECGTPRSWEELEPDFAAVWERLRSAKCPHWDEVRERVRAACRDNVT